MAEVSGVNGAKSEIQPVKITIKKNQGITQALFDLVKNENLSGGKIDATEWKNALSVLNEIQANREKNGQADIFTGGSGNDYHKNYVVKTGQQIEFTSEEIQKLYNALGVTLKDEKSTQPAQGTTQTGQTVCTGEVKQTPQKTETPKSKVPQDARRTVCSGVLYSKSTDKYYKIENGEYVEIKGKHGGRVFGFEKDGHYYEKLSWDKNGMRVNYCNSSGYVEKTSIYDNQARPIKETYYKNGKPVSSSTYKYTQYGRTEKYFEHNKGWKRTETYNYNNSGRETGGALGDGTKFTTRYLKDGVSFMRSFTRNDGSHYYWIFPSGGNAYECDANGKPFK